MNRLASENRRDFLTKSSAATMAALATGFSPRLGNARSRTPHASAHACILIWMAGGMAAPETLDPKRYEPFEVGLEAKKIISTFPAIDTAVDHIKISKGLENIAKILNRGTLIRSHVQADLGNILHSRHQYHWHTGYVPPQTVAAPHIGAWIARLLGPRNQAIPAFIDIGQRLEGIGEKEELKAFHTAGFLGSEYGPFVLPYPGQAIESVRPPSGMTPSRFAKRFKKYRELVNQSLGDRASDFQKESMMRSMENAHRLLSSEERKAFDLALEPDGSYARYVGNAPLRGRQGRFGRGCLLARRLVESGARFIEVTSEYVPFLNWDTHENGHTTAERMKQEIDRPIAQLILDLEERGLLDQTLVVVASEFSRDMIIEGVPGSTAKDQSRAKADVMADPKQYGLHRHFTGGSSVLMFGGGIGKGKLYGKTADERPCIAIENPISIMDMHATIFRAMGIAPDTALDVEKRPFYITEDGKGKPVEALFE